MTKQEQIALFLDNCITLPRDASFYGWAGEQWRGFDPYPYVRERPRHEQVAQELLAMSEFKALQLGSWLGTTDGQVISEAVEMVTPPFYQEDVELLVDALTLAAQLQSQEGQDKAGKIALVALGIAGIVVIGIAGSGARAA